MKTEASASHPPTGDLVVLTADVTMLKTLRSILSRHQSLQIRPLKVRLAVHPDRDPGCFHNGPGFLQVQEPNFHHALIFLDREGSGQDHRLTCEEMAADLEERLRSDWGDRATAIVLDPELESWWWSDSAEVARVMGWPNLRSLRSWLRGRGFLQEVGSKPLRPKEALEAALEEVETPRDSALYVALAKKVSLHRCQDPSFLRFKSILQRWFPANPI